MLMRAAATPFALPISFIYYRRFSITRRAITRDARRMFDDYD